MTLDDIITLYLLELQRNILKNPKEAQIVVIKDVSDILEINNNESGRRLFFGLMGLVKKLQKEDIPVTLVACCSPPISNEKNLEKDQHFYAQLLEDVSDIPKVFEANSV